MYCVLMCNPCLSYIVTKQRDPETGQQSLLFQVSALIGFVFVDVGRFLNKQINIKAQLKGDAIKTKQFD